MEMKAQIIGGGVTLGQLNSGFLHFRESPNATPKRYTLGGGGLRKPESADADWITTEWSPVSTIKHAWLKRFHSFVGKRGELKISGNSIFGLGEVAVEISVYDKYGHPLHSLKAKFIEPEGFSFFFGERKASGIIHKLSQESASAKEQAEKAAQ